MSDDDQNVDPLPAMMAELDQAVAMVLANAANVAIAARGAYEAYVAEGFTERQALYLTACGLKDNPGPAPG